MASADVHRARLTAPEMTVFSTQPPVLRSNQGSEVGSASTGWMLPTSLSIPRSEMRARYDSDGYIWIKNLIPREDVLDMREQYLTSLTYVSCTPLLLIISSKATLTNSPIPEYSNPTAPLVTASLTRPMTPFSIKVSAARPKPKPSSSSTSLTQRPFTENSSNIHPCAHSSATS